MSDEQIPAPVPTPTPAAAAPKPGWLPPHIPYNGDWETFVKALYVIFDRDFKRVWPRFRAAPVWHDRRVESGDKYGFEEAFWHLVTRDEWVYSRESRRNEKGRYPDFDRAGRLPWAKPIIVNEAEIDMTVWDFDQETARGKVVRTYLWLKNHDYVVILERQKRDKGDIFMLVTSFFADVKSKQVDLQSRYERRRK